MECRAPEGVPEPPDHRESLSSHTYAHRAGAINFDFISAAPLISSFLLSLEGISRTTPKFIDFDCPSSHPFNGGPIYDGSFWGTPKMKGPRVTLGGTTNLLSQNLTKPKRSRARLAPEKQEEPRSRPRNVC